MVGPAYMASSALVVTEEKDLVFFDRTAQGTAELVPIAAGYGNLTRRQTTYGSGTVNKWILSEIGIGALEIEQRTMQIVAAGLCLGGHHSTYGFPKLRIVILGGDFDLCYCLKVRVNYNDA